jgi:hypothetical protein
MSQEIENNLLKPRLGYSKISIIQGKHKQIQVT